MLYSRYEVRIKDERKRQEQQENREDSSEDFGQAVHCALKMHGVSQSVRSDSKGFRRQEQTLMHPAGHIVYSRAHPELNFEKL